MGINVNATIEAADALVEGRLEVFGVRVSFIDGIPDWNRDPATGIEIPLSFGLFIDFRHIPGVDIKHLWEVNRHCWWVPVAQAYTLSNNPLYLHALKQWLISWLDSCPYPHGPNWSSPVEHGIRLINWSLVWHLIGGKDSPMFNGAEGQALKERWLRVIYQHMRFAHDNYSLYSSADNHLIGEAAGIFIAGQTWDLWENGRRMTSRALEIIESEVLKQFAFDGVNREQAICYHKFSLEFLLASALSYRANDGDFSVDFWNRIEAACNCLAAFMDVAGNVPSIGDADDASVFKLDHRSNSNVYQSWLVVAASLFSSAELWQKVRSFNKPLSQDLALWLLGDPIDFPELPATPASMKRFDDGGYLILGSRLDASDEIRVIFDVGPLGYNGIGGHAHADALSLSLSWCGTPILVDSGTYCYNVAPEWRHFFRGTSAHNTLEVAGTDQSVYGGSFLWLRDYSSTLEECIADEEVAIAVASHDGYMRLDNPARHRRRVSAKWASAIIDVTDSLDVDHPQKVVLHWHLAPGSQVSKVRDTDGELVCIRTSNKEFSLHISTFSVPSAQIDIVIGQEAPPQGWVSRTFYSKEPAPVVRIQTVMGKNSKILTSIRLGGEQEQG